ncbi:MAG: excinuclease ABC subunit UvrB [bacterium]|nr:excinuclease ABC subunit UvrB [bacterium]
MGSFDLKAPFKPSGDQPAAIERLVAAVEEGHRHVVLLGVTGSGKTFTVANLVARIKRPTLVISHNKTLAAQLCGEFKEFFPESAVEYFVSYYDYYQPEAYLPQTDTFIEKEALINDEIDKLRHSATSALLERRDVLVVASVSCIYGLGSPADYRQLMLSLRVGRELDRDQVLRDLVQVQYQRNDVSLVRGSFRVRGDALEILPAGSGEKALRVEFFGDEVERIAEIDVLTGEVLGYREHVAIYPASHYATMQDKLRWAAEAIEVELVERLAWLRGRGRLVEAQRLETRTRHDLEMIREAGYCAGIENYSRYLTGRQPGERPYTLMDFFPRDLLVVVDESHQTIPQIRAMYHGDRSRKESLVEHGFRLPSAYDNRPLTFEEFEAQVGQVVYISATPGPYERERAGVVVEQIVRPTGLVDPAVEVRPTAGQIDDLVGELRGRVRAGERALVTTLTKKLAEDLTDYLTDVGIKARYLHSEVDTLERMEILRDLRLGSFDVLVGINLLREGLDLPEVSLVAILDADREGYLRSATSLIQTTGRAARNVNGKVVMYADTMTDSMRQAIAETERRRSIQGEHNRRHGITPETVRKAVREVIQATRVAERKSVYLPEDLSRLNRREIPGLIERLHKEMKEASRRLEFERAADLRDMIFELEELARRPERRTGA